GETFGKFPYSTHFCLPSKLVNSSLIRRKRYIINPMGHKWNHFNITYKIVQFPSTLSKYDTRKGISTAFGIWSNVSPLTFAEVHGRRNADIKLGFYTFEHSDCWSTMLHPCFDGRNGELAHAFLPPVGEIHFDNHDAWILGKARFDRNQGVWLNDLIQVAAHEIGHALGLMHSQNQNSLMHPSITYTGQRDVTQDDISGIQQLYACHDKRRFCGSWARVGFCERRQTFMKDNCPKSCNVFLWVPSDWIYSVADTSLTIDNYYTMKISGSSYSDNQTHNQTE
uniref:ShKT domain-containing protein n=1 Tax=Callorhinchus milii TaxID=7868 RepID=A0A4W3IZ16_CALMI